MMLPDATTLHNPSPEYIRALVDRTCMSQEAIAGTLGITARSLRYYMTPENDRSHVRAPYLVQFGLEVMAHQRPGLGLGKDQNRP